ncbi:MAG: DUF4390 domain-containing protein [Rudaea sp.]
MRSASIDANVLVAQLTWQPDAVVLDALDHGIVLEFVVTAQALAPGMFGLRAAQTQQRHVQLRYFPLTRQYQVQVVEDARTRSYAARALALAAIEDLHLPLAAWHQGAIAYRVCVALDRDALPGALRLPALFAAAWRIDSGDYTWRARAG